MKNIILVMASLTLSVAHADYKLARNGKTVTCYGEDNTSWVLNAKRTTLKFVIEGESNGAQAITNVVSDEKAFVAYTSDEGTLTLSDAGDTFTFGGEEDVFGVSCR